MIDNFRELILSYVEEYQAYSASEILSNEIKSTSGFNSRTVLINERIKVSDTFTHYIIERCKPSEVTPLRKLVEEYEKYVAIIKDSELSGEHYDDIKNVTVVLDILFGIDVTYSSNLYELIQEEKIDKIADYLEENFGYELSYDSLINIINGYGQKL